MIGSLYAGLSGLRSHETQLDVVGNNIANMNTVGYKRSRVTFEEMLATSLKPGLRPSAGQGGLNPTQVGMGTQIGSISTIFEQGGLQSTGNKTDLAIQGSGFFVVSDGNKNVFTRDGSFQFDGLGRLVSSANGFIMQGIMADSTGKLPASSTPQDIVIDYGFEVPAKATTRLKLSGNLDAAAPAKGTILESDRVYAVELAGQDNDINGLYANGSTNTAITGMSVGSTTVSLTDNGIVGTKTYTYTDIDMGVGDHYFNSLDDLVEEINNDFDGSLSVSLDESGQLVFSNLSTEDVVDPDTGEVTSSTPSENLINITSTNSLFRRALSSVNGRFTEGTVATDEFSHVAVESDLVTDLRNYQGTNLGIEVGDQVSIDGLLGNGAIESASLDIDTITNYDDLIYAINTALRINNPTGTHVNANTGGIRIDGDGGSSYDLSRLNIQATGADGTEKANFNDLFDSSPENWLVVQEAEDAQHSATVTAYDSLGFSHQVTMVFTKDTSVENRWMWNIEVPEPATITSGGSGSVAFNDDGSLQSFSYDGGETALTFDPGTGSTNPVSLNLDLGQGANDDSGITQFESVSTAVVTEQDGYTMGKLESIQFDQSGLLIGIFSNGETQTIAQVSLADFANESGLLRTGDNMYEQTVNSGNAVIGEAGVTIDGAVVSGALELSNVDLSEEFSSMIIAQRGYQANARTITTADALLQEVISLKR